MKNTIIFPNNYGQPVTIAVDFTYKITKKIQNPTMIGATSDDDDNEFNIMWGNGALGKQSLFKGLTPAIGKYERRTVTKSGNKAGLEKEQKSC